jgi:hypothetical protein
MQLNDSLNGTKHTDFLSYDLALQQSHRIYIETFLTNFHRLFFILINTI